MSSFWDNYRASTVCIVIYHLSPRFQSLSLLVNHVFYSLNITESSPGLVRCFKIHYHHHYYYKSHYLAPTTCWRKQLGEFIRNSHSLPLLLPPTTCTQGTWEAAPGKNGWGQMMWEVLRKSYRGYIFSYLECSLLEGQTLCKHPFVSPSGLIRTDWRQLTRRHILDETIWTMAYVYGTTWLFSAQPIETRTLVSPSRPASGVWVPLSPSSPSSSTGEFCSFRKSHPSRQLSWAWRGRPSEHGRREHCDTKACGSLCPKRYFKHFKLILY